MIDSGPGMLFLPTRGGGRLAAVRFLSKFLTSTPSFEWRSPSLPPTPAPFSGLYTSRTSLQISFSSSKYGGRSLCDKWKPVSQEEWLPQGIERVQEPRKKLRCWNAGRVWGDTSLLRSDDLHVLFLSDNFRLYAWLHAKIWLRKIQSS